MVSGVRSPQPARVALIEAGSPGLNIYSHVAMGRGVPLLATVLRDAGYDSRAFVEDISGKDSVDWEWVAGATVVGFSAITCTLPRTVELMRQARSVNPHATIVLGGPEPTCAYERSLGTGADLVLRGESEISLPRLVGVLSGTGSDTLQDIPGLVWREGERLCEGPPPIQLTAEQLDALPLVDRTLVHEAHLNSVAPVWRTRGCPDRCDFCEVVELYPRCVRRSDERTLEDLVDAQRAGYQTAFLIDDNAAANRPAFKEFLRKVGEAGFVQMLVTQLRADSVIGPDGRPDRELLKLLKKAAAVTVICVGVESADDSDLEEVHKRLDSTRMASGLKAMRRTGLLVHGMFIALKGDTADVIKRNGDYARKYVSSLQYLFETPLPGTKRTREHEESGSLLFRNLEDLRLFDGMHVVIEPERMMPVQMQELVAREYRRFYSVRRIVVAALTGTFGRFRVLGVSQREWLRAQRGWRRRLYWRLRLGIEYKYAPVSFLAIGRRRVRKILADPSYADFVERLRALEDAVRPAGVGKGGSAKA